LDERIIEIQGRGGHAMKRLIAVAAMGIFLTGVMPKNIWADVGGGAAGGSHGSSPSVSEPGAGKDILHNDLGIKGDSIKNKMDDVTAPLKRGTDIPNPGKIFKD